MVGTYYTSPNIPSPTSNLHKPRLIIGQFTGTANFALAAKKRPIGGFACALEVMDPLRGRL